MDISKGSINERFRKCIANLVINTPRLSKKKIAESLNIKQSKFSEILNARMGVSPDLLANFCLIYNIDMNWMLTGEYRSTEQKALILNEQDQNKYIGNSEDGYSKAINARLVDENVLLRDQLCVMQNLIKDQQVLIDAFKDGDIVVTKDK